MNYVNYEMNFQKKYRYYYERYPQAMILFDVILRDAERETNELSKIAFDRLMIKIDSTFSLKTFVKKIIFDFIKNRKNNDKPKAIVLLRDQRFSYLNNAVRKAVFSEGLDFVNVISVNQIPRINMHFLKSRTKTIDFETLFYSSNLKKIMKNFSYNKIDKFLKDDIKMKRLNLMVEESISAIATKLTNTNIRVIFMAEDQSYENQILCIAAQKVSIPTYVFLHGYPSGEYIGVLPIRAKRLLIWNEHQAHTLDRIFLGGQFNYSTKYDVFGYPRFDQKYINKKKQELNNKESYITFVSQPFEEVGQYIDRDSIYSKLQVLKRKGFNILVRLHPKEKNNTNKINEILSYDFKISQSELILDLLKSEWVIGFNSSVIYEAHIISKNAIQIENNLSDLRYENIPCIKEQEIPKLDELEILKNYKKKKCDYKDIISDFEISLKEYIKR